MVKSAGRNPENVRRVAECAVMKRRFGAQPSSELATMCKAVFTTLYMYRKAPSEVLNTENRVASSGHKSFVLYLGIDTLNEWTEMYE